MLKCKYDEEVQIKFLTIDTENFQQNLFVVIGMKQNKQVNNVSSNDGARKNTY